MINRKKLVSLKDGGGILGNDGAAYSLCERCLHVSRLLHKYMWLQLLVWFILHLKCENDVLPS